MSGHTDLGQPPARPFKGHRWFAARYDRCTRSLEVSLLGGLRGGLLGGLTGDVLEIGVGTGANLPHYRPGVHLVGTEPDPYMLHQARQKRGGLATAIDLYQVAAEDLPFAGSSFDHAVSTLVLCTVADPALALMQIRRVLRPEGQLHFIEHVRADGVLGWGQDAIRPLWQAVAAGCRPNRRIARLIEAAGFRIERLQTGRLNAVAPLIFGTARSAGGSGST